ncbi:unnamed protein product, partial [Ixodes persulcatus]
ENVPFPSVALERAITLPPPLLRACSRMHQGLHLTTYVSALHGSVRPTPPASPPRLPSVTHSPGGAATGMPCRSSRVLEAATPEMPPRNG